MDKISLIPTFKVLHWTISLRTFVLIANRKLIFSLPWGRNTLAYKESRWLSPEAGWRGLFYRESDVFPPPSCTLSGLSLLRIHTGTHTRPLAPTFWEGSPFMTANTLGFTIISIISSQRLSQTMCSSFQQYLWVVGAGETACLYLN